MSLCVCADVILHPPEKIKKKAASPLPAVQISTAAKIEPIALLDVPNNAFKIGEKLRFVIKYQFVNAGSATMSVNKGLIIQGRQTMHLESRAESTNFIDKFFKVRDVNSSTVDERSLASFSFHQNLKEGHYHVMRNTLLDYQNRTYSFEKTRKGKTLKESGLIDQPLQDILSSFFYTRTLPLELGKDYAITVFSDKEIFSLKVKVYPKEQEISVPAGKFQCLRVEPALVGDAIFKAKEGKMTIWLTNDNRRMPVLLRSKVFVGAFDAELAEYSGT